MVQVICKYWVPDPVLVPLRNWLLFILITLNLNDYMWLLAAVIGSAALESHVTLDNQGEFWRQTLRK